jgi:hypothetical protein
MTDQDPYAGVTWYAGTDLTIHGLAWRDQARELPYDRLPSRYLPDLPERLAANTLHPKGVSICFQGAPKQLFARFTLTGPTPASHQMSELAVSGLDVYSRRDGESWRFAGSRWPWNRPECNGKITFDEGGLDGVERQWRVHLPIAHRVASIEIGSREPLLPLARSTEQPIVYYGTSIVAESSVSRPGMPHASQLDRMLDHEVINLGFPSMAMLEPAMAKAIADQPAALFILDPIPNNSPEQIRENLARFMTIIHTAHPETPILLVQDRRFDNEHCTPQFARERPAKDQATDEVFNTLKNSGMKNIHLAAHENCFGIDGSVDGSHPNDLGAQRMAAALVPFVRPLLPSERCGPVSAAAQ